jgi:phage-related protein
VFSTVVNFIAQFIQAKFGYIFAAIQVIMRNVWNIIKNYWNIIKNIFLGVILIITDIVTGDFGAIKGHIKQIMANIKGSIQSIWNSIKTIFTTYVRTVVTFAKTSFNDMKNMIVTVFGAAKSFITNAVSAIKNWVTTHFNSMKTGVHNAMTGAKDAIVNAMKTAIKFLTSIDLVSIGKDIIRGLISGIKSMVGAVGSAIKEVASGIKEKIKGALGIKSPSRWMRDMVGKNIVLGMSVGIEREKGTVFDSMDALANNIKNTTLGIKPMNLQPDLNNALAFPKVQPVNETHYLQPKKEQTKPQEYYFNISVPIDGREVARTTVKYNQEELDKLQNKNGRFGGLLNGI